MKNQITVDVNNRQIMSLSQEKHDGDMTLTVWKPGGGEKGIDEWIITPGDFVMLMNYYRTQKESGKPIF